MAEKTPFELAQIVRKHNPRMHGEGEAALWELVRLAEATSGLQREIAHQIGRREYWRARCQISEAQLDEQKLSKKGG